VRLIETCKLLLSFKLQLEVLELRLVGGKILVHLLFVDLVKFDL
jgi:hypothetical protein